MAKQPLYETIFQHYQSLIEENQLKPGDRLPTEAELLEQFNVSRITVIRALKELEQSNYIHRIKGSGSYVNETAKWQHQGHSEPQPALKIISLIMPFDDHFSSEYLRGVEDICQQHDYFVTFHNSSESSRREKEIIEDVIRRKSAGIIVYTNLLATNTDLYSRLLIQKYPFVIMDHQIPGLETNLVSADNRQGFTTIVGHLFEAGHKRVIMVATSVNNISSEALRYQGFCKAHLQHGTPLLEKHLYQDLDFKPTRHALETLNENDSVRFAIQSFFDGLLAIPESDRPTAIAAVNDDLARILLEVALSRGIAVPENFAITGFDNLPWAAHLPVPLTTMQQPTFRIGQEAAKKLIADIGKPGNEIQQVSLESQLVVRQSG